MANLNGNRNSKNSNNGNNVNNNGSKTINLTLNLNIPENWTVDSWNTQNYNIYNQSKTLEHRMDNDDYV